MYDNRRSGYPDPTPTFRAAALSLLVVLVILTVVAAFACPAQAEPLGLGSVSGTVVNGNTNTPLEGVGVVVVETGAVARTDGEGRFVIADLPPGTYTLRVSHSGFAVVERALQVSGTTNTTTAAIALEPLPRFLTEVVVTPSHYSLYREDPEVRTSLSREEVDRTPHFGEDVLRTVRWLPGTTGEDLSSRSNVRGGDADETLLILDGVEIQEGFHLKELFSLLSIIDDQAIDSLEFMSGGFPVEYGNRMSGVIDISSSSGRIKRTSIGVSTNNLGLLSEGSFAGGRGGWLLSVRRTDLGNVIHWADPDSGLEPDFHDILAKVTYQVGGNTVLSATALTARDRIHYTEVNGHLEELMDTSSTVLYGWLAAKTSWSPRLYSRTILSTGSVDRERAGMIDYVDQEGTVDDTRTFDVNGFKQDWTFQVSNRHSVRWGFDLQRVEASYDYSSVSIISDPLFVGFHPRTTERDYDLRLDGNSYAAYLVDRFRFGDSLIAEVGARWDQQSYTDENQYSPRVNLSYLLDDRTTLRAAWGLYSQAQRLDELQVTDGVTTFFPAQRAEHRLLSLEHAFRAGYELRVELYQKVLTDIRPRYENLLNPIEIFQELEADRILVAPQRGEARGVELMVRRSGLGRWDWWASYIYAETVEEIDGETYPRSWDQPHTLNLSVNYRPNARWNFNISGVYHSGWPTTAVHFNHMIDPYGNQTVTAHLGRRNNERLDDYSRLDIRVSRDFHLRRSVCSLFLEVINVLNRDNLARPESFSWTPDQTGTLRLETEYESFMPIIPSLGIRWTM